jgi:putative hydrolase of the HAD superfamily
MKFDAVIFDLDDTLYPESQFVLGGLRSVASWALKRFGVREEATFLEFKTLYLRGIRGTIFDEWLNAKALYNKGIVLDMVRIYREHRPNISPFPETLTSLSYLKKKCKLGMVTDGYLSVQKSKFKALNIGSFFNAVIFSDQWGRQYWKPHPKPFIELLKLIDIKPDKCLYVGDNPLKDFLPPNKLGMQTARIIRPGGEYEKAESPAREYAPHYSITSLKEIISLIETNGCK